MCQCISRLNDSLEDTKHGASIFWNFLDQEIHFWYHHSSSPSYPYKKFFCIQQKFANSSFPVDQTIAVFYTTVFYSCSVCPEHQWHQDIPYWDIEARNMLNMLLAQPYSILSLFESLLSSSDSLQCHSVPASRRRPMNFKTNIFGQQPWNAFKVLSHINCLQNDASKRILAISKMKLFAIDWFEFNVM